MQYTQQTLSSLLDPITHDIFRDPVIASDKHTYERSSIKQWWRKCDREEKPRHSPMTREEMTDTLMDNLIVKRLADEWLEHIALQRKRSKVEGTATSAGDADEATSSLFSKLRIFTAAFDAAEEHITTVSDSPPLFVLLGDACSGKSKLLERLTLTQLFPTENGESSSTQMITKFCFRRAESASARLVVCNLRTGAITSAADVLPEELVPAIQATVEAAVLKETADNVRGLCQHSMLTVHIKSPAVRDLDIVDVPELENTAAKNMIEQYLDRLDDSMFYILTMAANASLDAAVEDSAALKFVEQRQVKPSTMVVLTNVEAGNVTTESDRLANVLRSLEAGEDPKSEQGQDLVELKFVVTANVQLPNGNATCVADAAKAQASLEGHWFQQEATALSQRGALPFEALVDWMVDKYKRHYAEARWVHDALSQLERAYDQIVQRQAQLGEPPAQSAQTMNVAELVAAATLTLTNMKPTTLNTSIWEILDGDRLETSRFDGPQTHRYGMAGFSNTFDALCAEHADFLEERLSECEEQVREDIPRILSEDASPLKLGRFDNLVTALQPAISAVTTMWYRRTMQYAMDILRRFYKNEHDLAMSCEVEGRSFTVTGDYTATHRRIIAAAIYFARDILPELATYLPTQPHYWLENCAQLRTALREELQHLSSQISAVRSIAHPDDQQDEGRNEDGQDGDVVQQGEDQEADGQNDEEQAPDEREANDESGSEESNEPAERIRENIACLVSDIRSDVLDALQCFEELLNNVSPPVKMIVDAGAVPALMPLLGSGDHREWQAAARILCALTAIDSEDEDLAFEMNQLIMREILPTLLLRAAAESDMGSTKALIRILQKISWQRLLLYVPVLQKTLSWLATVIMRTDHKVLTEACHILREITANSSRAKAELLDTGCGPRLIQLLPHWEGSVRRASLALVGEMCIPPGDESADDHGCAWRTVDRLTMQGLLPMLKRLLADPTARVRASVCDVLTNVAQHGDKQARTIIETGVLPCLVAVLEDNTNMEAATAGMRTIRSIAKSAASASAFCDSKERRQVIRALSGLVTAPHNDVRADATSCMYHLLIHSATSREAQPVLNANLVADMYSCGLVATLEQLRGDHDKDGAAGEHEVELLSLLKRANGTL